MKRIPITPSIRFEVLKRDSFKCQYCGASAPNVELHVDHIIPVKLNGTNDLMNLITACQPCNAGKSARSLSDDSVVIKRRKQTEEMQSRKEQLEMMAEWQVGLESLEEDTTQSIANSWEELTGFEVNERGLEDIRILRKTYDHTEILNAIKKSTEYYIIYINERPLPESVVQAWVKIKGICVNERRGKIPGFERINYIIAILERRSPGMNKGISISLIKKAILSKVPTAYIEEHAKTSKNVSEWKEKITDLIKEYKNSNKEEAVA